MSETETIRRTVRLGVAQGLHIRVCSNVTSIVSGFSGKVFLHYGEKVADASSMFDLMSLAALPNSELIVEANGNGAAGIVEQLEHLLTSPAPEPHDA